MRIYRICIDSMPNGTSQFRQGVNMRFFTNHQNRLLSVAVRGVYADNNISSSFKWLLCALLLCVAGLGAANAFDKDIAHKDFTITLSSPKNFTSGQNHFELVVKKDNKAVQISDVKVIFTMPEMPGMPRMSEDSAIEIDGTKAKGTVSFPHGGTWQIKIAFTYDSNKYQAKSSIDF